MDVPHLKLPEAKDLLYVVKPIGEYEPFKNKSDIDKEEERRNRMEGNTKKDNLPDPKTEKKPFDSEPKNHAEIRDCNSILTGE